MTSAVGGARGAALRPTTSGRAFVSCYAMWQDATDDAANLHWLPSTMAELEPLALGHYVAETDLPATASRAQRSFAEPNWQRLQELRRRFDPDGIFPTYLGPGERSTDAPLTRA